MRKICVKREKIQAIVPAILISRGLAYRSRAQGLYGWNSARRKEFIDIQNGADPTGDLKGWEMGQYFLLENKPVPFQSLAHVSQCSIKRRLRHTPQ